MQSKAEELNHTEQTQSQGPNAQSQSWNPSAPSNYEIELVPQNEENFQTWRKKKEKRKNTHTHTNYTIINPQGKMSPPQVVKNPPLIVKKDGKRRPFPRYRSCFYLFVFLIYIYIYIYIYTCFVYLFALLACWVEAELGLKDWLYNVAITRQHAKVLQ